MPLPIERKRSFVANDYDRPIRGTRNTTSEPELLPVPEQAPRSLGNPQHDRVPSTGRMAKRRTTMRLVPQGDRKHEAPKRLACAEHRRRHAPAGRWRRNSDLRSSCAQVDDVRHVAAPLPRAGASRPGARSCAGRFWCAVHGQSGGSGRHPFTGLPLWNATSSASGMSTWTMSSTSRSMSLQRSRSHRSDRGAHARQSE